MRVDRWSADVAAREFRALGYVSIKSTDLQYSALIWDLGRPFLFPVVERGDSDRDESLPSIKLRRPKIGFPASRDLSGAA